MEENKDNVKTPDAVVDKSGKAIRKKAKRSI